MVVTTRAYSRKTIFSYSKVTEVSYWPAPYRYIQQENGLSHRSVISIPA